MKIVFLTAEPFGGYHLEPLTDELNKSGAEIVYLIPYPTGVQGNGVPFEVSDNIYELNDADRVVITGGTYTGWTLSAIEYLKKINKPFLYLELAYIGEETKNLSWHQPEKALTVSEYSASILGEVWDRDVIKVVGSPQLDFVPGLKKARLERIPSNKVLIYSSVSSPDNMAQLLKVAEGLLDEGYNLEVRTHPREDVSKWVDLGISISDRSQPLSEALVDIDYAVGVLGTFNSVLAASGLATAVVLESSNPGAPSEFISYTHIWKRDLSIKENLERTYSVSRSGRLSTPVTGPVGGSAFTIVKEILG